MNKNLPLPAEKKLTVEFRVEPGCLGPDGLDYVDDFCIYAQKEIEPVDADFIHWDIAPRFDKATPETQYKINNKKLSYDKAAKYLEIFDKDMNEFEGRLYENFALLIEQYFGR